MLQAKLTLHHNALECLFAPSYAGAVDESGMLILAHNRLHLNRRIKRKWTETKIIQEWQIVPSAAHVEVVAAAWLCVWNNSETH